MDKLDLIKANVTEAARLKRFAADTTAQADACTKLADDLVGTLDDAGRAEYDKFRADFDKKEAARG